VGVSLGRLLIDGVSDSVVEGDGVGMAVSSGIAGGEAADDAAAGVAELLKKIV